MATAITAPARTTTSAEARTVDSSELTRRKVTEDGVTLLTFATAAWVWIGPAPSPAR